MHMYASGYLPTYHKTRWCEQSMIVSDVARVVISVMFERTGILNFERVTD
jgi:hypothetical protein